MTARFGELVDEAATEKGLKDYQLQGLFGAVIVDGKIKQYSSKQVGRLRAGEVKQVDRWMVDRFIEILDLDRDEAYEAAGFLPDEFTVEHLRLMRLLDEADDAAAAAALQRYRRHRSARRATPKPTGVAPAEKVQAVGSRSSDPTTIRVS